MKSVEEQIRDFKRGSEELINEDELAKIEIKKALRIKAGFDPTSLTFI